MKQLSLSALELAYIPFAENSQSAIALTLQTAQHIETLGYKRVWMAEHHNAPYIASSSPAVLIAHIAAHTKNIRVGAGGVMLPNHNPLIVAEQFGTLDTLYPGRIDLGLGRAPGTDPVTARALRKTEQPFDFAAEIDLLQSYLSEQEEAPVKAFPQTAGNIPLWILGTSTDSALLAAKLGLPYAYATHIAPYHLEQAAALYRTHFKPSAQWEQPYLMATATVVAAETDAAAELLATSAVWLYAGIASNTPTPLLPPDPLDSDYLDSAISGKVNDMMQAALTGCPDTIREKIKRFAANTGIDELMLHSPIYDIGSKLRSFEIVRQAVAG